MSVDPASSSTANSDSCSISQSCPSWLSPTKADPMPNTLPCIRTMTETLKQIRRKLTERDYIGGRKTDQVNVSSSTWLTREEKNKVRYRHRRTTKPWSVHSEGLGAAPSYPLPSLSLPLKTMKTVPPHPEIALLNAKEMLRGSEQSERGVGHQQWAVPRPRRGRKF